MKIKIHGFELIMGRGISLNSFFQHLMVGVVEDADNFILVVSEVEEYWIGVFLTIKDVETYCKMKKEGRKFTVTHEELEKNTNIVHYNYFIVNKNTGRGLYQYYWGSSSVNKFNWFMAKQYSKYKKSVINRELSNGQLLKPVNYKDVIERKYDGSLTYTIMERREEFKDRVKNMSKVSSFSFDYTTLDVREAPFRPLAGVARRVEHRVYFDGSVGKKARVKKAIASALSKLTGRYQVRGTDPYGYDVVYRSTNDYDVFQEFDYDTITKKIYIDSDNLKQSVDGSELITSLLEISNRPSINALLTTEVE